MTLHEDMKRAATLFRSLTTNETHAIPIIVAALRQAADEALERAAKIARGVYLGNLGSKEGVRSEIALQIEHVIASPAATPAAGRTEIVGKFVCDKCNVGDHGDHHPGYAGICLGCACEWLPAPPSEPVAPAAITYVNAEQWAAEGQQPLDDKKPREPRCQCHQEEGDSPCPIHGEEDPVAPSLLHRVLAALESCRDECVPNGDRWRKFDALAAELRRYIAEMEPRNVRDADSISLLQWKARARSAEAKWRSHMAALLTTIGGEVEGAPTAEHNFLQRLRELTTKELLLAKLQARTAARSEGET